MKTTLYQFIFFFIMMTSFVVGSPIRNLYCKDQANHLMIDAKLKVTRNYLTCNLVSIQCFLWCQIKRLLSEGKITSLLLQK